MRELYESVRSGWSLGVRDRLISGLHDKELRRRILQETYNEELTLTKVVTFCQAAEMSEQSERLRNTAVDTELAISAASGRSGKLSKCHSNKTLGDSRAKSSCQYRGLSPSHSRVNCPAQQQ